MPLHSEDPIEVPVPRKPWHESHVELLGAPKVGLNEGTENNEPGSPYQPS